MNPDPIKHNISRIGLGTHLGSFSDEDSRQYTEAVSFAVKNGITAIDTAINYRGMRSEKDVGNSINALISSGEIRREDVFISSKAGLLFGDITRGLNPAKYLLEVLEPTGIHSSDFSEFEGLYQTLNPDFYEIALQTSLQNLRISTIDVHYIHIPEITRARLPEDDFYQQMADLFTWYESKVTEGKIRFYGLAFEMLCMEPEEEKWYVNIERMNRIAREISNGNSHFKYLQIPYNMKYPFAATVQNQPYKGENFSLIEAAHKMGLKVIGSMPLNCGEGLKESSLEEMISFALNGVDAINVGSKNAEHIQEILGVL
ncbi:MAG: aldo/keto reductase [Eubacterium sp.]|nr:aldo/keto reductase [Eubacterium sp.]